RGDQEIFELLLAQQRRRRGLEVFDNHALSMADGEAVRTVRVHSQFPPHHIGAGHEEAEHEPSSRKQGTRFGAWDCTVSPGGRVQVSNNADSLVSWGSAAPRPAKIGIH